MPDQDDEFTASSTAIFVPFTTCELFMGGSSLYYGLNALSNNLIMADRKEIKKPERRRRFMDAERDSGFKADGGTATAGWYGMMGSIKKDTGSNSA